MANRDDQATVLRELNETKNTAPKLVRSKTTEASNPDFTGRFQESNGPHIFDTYAAGVFSRNRFIRGYLLG